MNQTISKPAPYDTGMSMEQMHEAVSLRQNIDTADKGLIASRAEKLRFTQAEIRGGVFGGLNLIGIIAVNAGVGLSKLALWKAEREARQHYVLNMAAYQGQAVYEASRDGTPPQGW